MANRLFIIEAPGKEAILGRILYQVFRQRCEIIATVGHICENPKSLDMPWINDDLTEHAYHIKPERHRLIDKLRLAARVADEIYIATDDDHEGDVIARDVFSNALDSSEHNKLYRVKLRAMTIEEVRRAVADREVYFPDANKGDARRILDRLIGRLSNPKGAVGRVQGSMLIELSSNNPVVGVAQLQIPAQDGGSPFCSNLPIFAGDEFDFEEINHLCKQHQIAPGRVIETTSSSTWNHSDILLNCSLSTGRPLTSIAEAMQRLYEKGQMTYPRSSQRTVSSHSICKTQIIAKMQGVNFRPELVSNTRAASSSGHEAPSIIESDLPLHRRVDESTDTETAVKILIARNQVESGMPCKITFGEPSSIAVLPEALKNLQWVRRDVPGLCLWLGDKEPSLKLWTKEQSLIHFMQQTQLGRPSTIIVHIDKFLSRELVNDDFSFTNKGNVWLNNHKEIFHNKNISNIIEQYLDANNDLPSEMVMALLDVCQLDVSNSVGINRPDRQEIQENCEHEFTTLFN